MVEIEQIDNQNTIIENLGIELVEFTPERVAATMPVTGKVRQPFGIMHGGASVVLAETVASVGCAHFIDLATQRVVGLEINANHIRSKSEGVVTGVGTPVHVGRRTIVWDIRIVDEEERLICISRCTMAVLDIAKSEE